VALGPVDADAIPDLVVLNQGSFGFAVHPGVGDGTFGAPSHHPTGLAARDFMELLDVNGDGELDVLVSGGGVSVFLGTGDGSFLPAIVTEGSIYILADIDGDGRPDMAGYLQLWLGNGDGTFQPPLPITYTPAGSRGGAAGDFDGDGRTDLAQFAFSYLAPEIWVLPNDCLNTDMRLKASGDSLQWRAVCGAQSYNVYRQEFSAAPSDGDEDGLPDEGYGECVNDLDVDPTDTTLVDAEIPFPGGNGFSYLVSWVDLAGEGGLGATSAGLPREVALPCP